MGSGETSRTGRELGKRKGQRTASLSHQRSHRAPGSLEERAKRPNRETPAPRCHSETVLETRELLQKIMVLKLFGTWHRRSSTGFRPTLGLSDLRFEDSEVLRSSDQGPGWSRGFWLAWQLNEV